ncbi:DUF1349 domain-containing protein [Bailinhaonella thermotolerans]|uniref:DUF1349 domain-containing protein n=2 Tax=Bailinhaonella thermotolerans TaxID=1070861 RepID=A0A3A4BML3_9ACTN|nr:DUF1349 domain-containing protein [Bailinhaonella thermotolerans]
MEWWNEPREWTGDAKRLDVVPDARSDFWRTTHYGFVRDTGHVFGRTVAGDADLSVRLRGDYRDLYDQGGLMLRVDAENWIKFGVEYVDRRLLLSAVVTREFSDWSTTPAPDGVEELWFRMSRRGDTVEMSWSPDGSAFETLRLAYLPPGVPAFAGAMCAAPDGDGFPVTFEDLRVDDWTAV